MSTLNQQKGNTVLTATLGLLAIAVIAGALYYVWRVQHRIAPKTTAATHKPATPLPKTNPTPDPYAGWKERCDTTYHYCFNYPSDWNFAIQLEAEEPCAAGEATLSSPSGAIEMQYINDNNHDGGLASFNPVMVDASLPRAKDLAILGGYVQLGGSFYASLNIVDASLLKTHPVAIGQETQLPQPFEFTDQGIEAKSCEGSFWTSLARPVASSDDAKAWFASNEAKQALQILQSFHHE